MRRFLIQKKKWIKDTFKRELYSLNPTAWEMVDGEWKRLEGF